MERKCKKLVKDARTTLKLDQAAVLEAAESLEINESAKNKQSNKSDSKGHISGAAATGDA